MVKALKKKKVLAIDDDEAIRDVLQILLEEAGFDIITSSVFDEKKIEEINPDIIFLDISIAGVDGKKAGRDLKASPRLRHVPLIILSAFSKKEVSTFAKDAGADGYLLKPFDLSELTTTITQFTNR